MLNHTKSIKHLGFTLTEMLLVIAIIGIMTGAILPHFTPIMKSMTLKHAASSFSDIVRYSRSLAVERSSVAKLLIDLESHTVTLVVEADPFMMPGEFIEERVPFPYPKEYSEKVKFASIQKMTVTILELENEITFQPDGTTDDTFVYFTDEDENMYTVGIIGLTGQVLVWQGLVDNFYAE